MKRILVPIILIALAATAFFFRDRFLPATPGQTELLGYVEGETVMVASPVAGRIVARPIERGGAVATGAMVVQIDAQTQQAAVAQAAQAVTTAEAQAANLQSGKRPEELDVLRAQRKEAEASLKLARQELQRATELTGSGTASKARYDTAAAQVAQIEARIAQIDANLKVGELAGRDQDIAAAQSRVEEARAALATAKVKLSDFTTMSPITARVEDTFFDVGEWVTAGQPIASLLPYDALTLRFYVPEASLAKAQPGTVVIFHCDGCDAAGTAKITRVASQPEYTPPIIYSQGARAKLVYLVEAKPESADPRLRPGLPVAVEPLP